MNDSALRSAVDVAGGFGRISSCSHQIPGARKLLVFGVVAWLREDKIGWLLAITRALEGSRRALFLTLAGSGWDDIGSWTIGSADFDGADEG